MGLYLGPPAAYGPALARLFQPSALGFPHLRNRNRAVRLAGRPGGLSEPSRAGDRAAEGQLSPNALSPVESAHTPEPGGVSGRFRLCRTFTLEIDGWLRGHCYEETKTMKRTLTDVFLVPVRRRESQKSRPHGEKSFVSFKCQFL